MSNNTIFTATNLGPLSGTRTLNDFVGTDDNFDFFKFDLAQNSDLNLVFESESALTVSLIADLNNNGVVDRGETVFSRSTFFGNTVSEFESLPTDTYFVQVERAFSNSANYDLTLIETPRPGTVATDPGNTIDDALDLGSITGSIELNDYAGDLDEYDFYQFTLDQNSDISLSVRNITTSTTALFTYLIADENNNGIWDRGETIDSVGMSSNGSTLNVPLPAGTYLTAVQPSLSRSAHYQKTLTVTPNPSNLANDPGNTISTAFNLGNLSGNRTVRDYVGNQDDADFYQFRLTQKSTVDLTSTSSSPNVSGVRTSLVADLNNNGIIDRGETIENDGGSSNSFSEVLDPGTYFVRITFFDASHYNLRLSQTPDLSGNDRLRGTNRRDVIRGMDGNDVIIGLGGNDRLIGDAGNDRLVGNAGNDLLVGGRDRDVLVGGTGNDRLIGGTDRDVLVGGTGNDRLIGGTGRDRLIGSVGNDTLIGGSDRDVLIGGAGNDRMDGGAGNDRITTGGGRDQIVLRRNSRFDVVTDFQNGRDRIDLVGIRFGQLTLERDRNDVLIKLGRSNLMRLEDTNLAAINQADFV
jgi:Ca2+-binding RTX toxin-like protein